MASINQRFSYGVGPRQTRLAKSLGWFSIGLGLAEIFTPRTVARAIGVKSNPGLFAALGARELVAGVGLLTQRRPVGFMWSRVLGDAMDLALLGTALSERRTDKEKAGMALLSVVGVTALDILSAIQLTKGKVPDNARARGWRVERKVTINRSPEELYSFWRNFENLPQFMGHLQSVTVQNEKVSTWTTKGPGGKNLQWRAEIIQDKPNEAIGWHSLEGADVDNAGMVRFQPAADGQGTVVNVKLDYYPPGGAVGAVIAKLMGESPGTQVEQDLLTLKQTLETGAPTRTSMTS